MYVAMFNLTHFCAYNGLFFKYGNKAHLPSVILFVLSALTILLVFVKYYVDPDPFVQLTIF